MATCPECDAEIAIDGDDLEEMEIGDPWGCDACGTRLSVASLEPVEFEAEDEDEDEDEEEAEKEDEEKVEDDDEDADDTEEGEDWEE